MSQKSGFLIVSNGFFIENVGHTLTKNYNGTYWPLTRAENSKRIKDVSASNVSHVLRKLLQWAIPENIHTPTPIDDTGLST